MYPIPEKNESRPFIFTCRITAGTRCITLKTAYIIGLALLPAMLNEAESVDASPEAGLQN